MELDVDHQGTQNDKNGSWAEDQGRRMYNNNNTYNVSPLIGLFEHILRLEKLWSVSSFVSNIM